LEGTGRSVNGVKTFADCGIQSMPHPITVRRVRSGGNRHRHGDSSLALGQLDGLTPRVGSLFMHPPDASKSGARLFISPDHTAPSVPNVARRLLARCTLFSTEKINLGSWWRRRREGKVARSASPSLPDDKSVSREGRKCSSVAQRLAALVCHFSFPSPPSWPSCPEERKLPLQRHRAGLSSAKSENACGVNGRICKRSGVIEKRLLFPSAASERRGEASRHQSCDG
jgi:hypothetical protein